jgi:hypothetical protein
VGHRGSTPFSNRKFYLGAFTISVFLWLVSQKKVHQVELGRHLPSNSHIPIRIWRSWNLFKFFNVLKKHFWECWKISINKSLSDIGPGAQTRNLNKLGLRYSCFNLMCHLFWNFGKFKNPMPKLKINTLIIQQTDVKFVQRLHYYKDE